MSKPENPYWVRWSILSINQDGSISLIRREIIEYVKEKKRTKRRNDSGKKKMESSLGAFELQIQRVRNDSFES